MKIRGLSVLASILMTCGLATPAAAGVSPYVRLDYGGSQFRMTDLNHGIQDDNATFQDAGFPAAFEKTGSGYGPGASVGVWIAPGLRLGATYSYLRAVRSNRFDTANPVDFAYSDELDLRMSEIGVEAAVRFRRLWGLTLGASVAQGRGEITEKLTVTQTVDVPDYYHFDGKAHRTKTTCGAFVGLDQTNDAGVAGYIQAGFQYRDFGHMAGEMTETDGVDVVRSTGRTGWLDYSGFYVKVGVGYDFVH